jgi:hypothetical protein
MEDNGPASEDPGAATACRAHKSILDVCDQRRRVGLEWGYAAAWWGAGGMARLVMSIRGMGILPM